MSHQLKRDKAVTPDPDEADMLMPVVAGGLYQQQVVRTVELRGDWLVYRGDERRRYFPQRQPEVADCFSRCNGPEGLLAFVQEYGPLGIRALGGSRQGPPRRPALADGVVAVEPTTWALAHVATVRWCLAMGYAVQKGAPLPTAPDVVGIGAALAFRDRRPLPGWENDDFWDSIAFAQAEFEGFAPPDIAVTAVSLNLARVERTLYYVERQFHATWYLPTLLNAIYLRTADMMATGTLVRCAAQDCGRYFMQANPKERYCPNPPGYDGRERLCAVRDRQRRARERARSDASANG